ncbi:hypothetical protein AB1L42_10755 [Thalassoglobus sp. JC818]
MFQVMDVIQHAAYLKSLQACGIAAGKEEPFDSDHCQTGPIR